MVTTAAQYKKQVSKGQAEIELPSGATCTMKAPGMQAFITQGFIPNSLLGIVTEQLNKNAGKPPSKQQTDEQAAVQFMEEIKGDPTKLDDLMRGMDQVWLHCVIEPQTHPTPAVDEHGKEIEKRDPKLLYVDEVDFDDKMFVMQVAVGGTKDLERFRTGLSSNVDAVQNRRRAVKPTKRTGGSTRKSR
jgi:hypothetical protein